jgi:hypothetical protein
MAPGAGTVQMIGSVPLQNSRAVGHLTSRLLLLGERASAALRAWSGPLIGKLRVLRGRGEADGGCGSGEMRDGRRLLCRDLIRFGACRGASAVFVTVLSDSVRGRKQPPVSASWLRRSSTRSPARRRCRSSDLKSAQRPLARRAALRSQHRAPEPEKSDRALSGKEFADVVADGLGLVEQEEVAAAAHHAQACGGHPPGHYA